MTEAIAIIGLGYVGLPIALRAVEAGYDVVGVEVDPTRFHSLVEHHSYVEDITDSDLTGAFRSDRFHVVQAIATIGTFDIAVITVPTPLREGAPISPSSRSPRRSSPAPAARRLCRARVDDVPGHHRGAHGAIARGGFGSRRRRRLPRRLSARSASTRATKMDDRHHAQDRLGHRRASPSSASQGSTPTSSSTSCRSSSPKVAELAKLLENTFRHVNIALVNELAMFAHDLGIDVWEAIDAAATKPFGFMRFTPGPGRRRPLPARSTRATCRGRSSDALGQTFRFVELANDVNEHMPDYVARRVARGAQRRGARRSKALACC